MLFSYVFTISFGLYVIVYFHIKQSTVHSQLGARGVPVTSPADRGQQRVLAPAPIRPRYTAAIHVTGQVLVRQAAWNTNVPVNYQHKW